MTTIAVSLSSLPPAPPFVPGGTAAVVAADMGPASRQHAPTAATEVRSGTRETSEEERSGRSPAATDAASIEEQRMLTDLKVRDREVRAHESAHRAAGGDLVRSGSYDYQQGPDGKRYAIGGDVQIDTTSVPDDPRATADKMAQVIRAALAPAKPSPTDLAVAAQATAERNRAQAEPRTGADAKGDDDRSSASTESGDAATAYRRTADQAAAGSNLNAMA